MATNSRIFEITKPTFKRRYEVSLKGGAPIITVDRSDWTPGVPELTFKDGPDAKSSPVMGFCRMHKWSGDMDIGIVIPGGAECVETLSKESMRGGEYRFAMPIPPDDARQTFSWKRTHSIGVAGSSVNPFSNRNFVLVDQQGKTVAVYTNESGLGSTCGSIEIKTHHGKQFDQMVIMTCVSIWDKAARRRAAAASAA